MLNLKRITDVLTSLHNWLLYEPEKELEYIQPHYVYNVGDILQHNIHNNWVLKVLGMEGIWYTMEDIYDAPGVAMPAKVSFIHECYHLYTPPTTQGRRCLNPDGKLS